MRACVRACVRARARARAVTLTHNANGNATVAEEIGQVFEIRELQGAFAGMPTRRSSPSKRSGFHRINILQTNYFRTNWKSN
jgi:hypothetical protein